MACIDDAPQLLPNLAFNRSPTCCAGWAPANYVVKFMRILLGLIALTGFAVASGLSLAAWTVGPMIERGYEMLLLACPAFGLVGLLAVYNWSLGLTSKTVGKLKDGPRWAMFVLGTVALYVSGCLITQYILMRGNSSLVEGLFGKYYLGWRGHREEIGAELATQIRTVRFSLGTAFIALIYWFEFHFVLVKPKFNSSLHPDASRR